MVPHATRIRRSTVAARTAMFGESWTVIFADTRSTVLLFETILPTRDYIDPGDAAFEHVEPSSMQKLYPYTGGGAIGLLVSVGETPDVSCFRVWRRRNSIPLLPVTSIASPVSFYNEKFDIIVRR